MVKLIHKERIAEGSTRRFLDGRRNDVEPRKHMVAKFRESHHNVAKLYVAGLKGKEISERTGYHENWLAQLHNDPAFQELIAKYRDLDTQLFLEGRQEFYFEAGPLMVQAMRHTREHFNAADDEGELIPLNQSIKVMTEMADRLGYAKHKVNINANVDFADALQKAIRRSGKTIDGTVSEGLGGMKLLAPTNGHSPVPQPVSTAPLAPEGPTETLVTASVSESAGTVSARSVEAQPMGTVPPRGAAEPRPLRRRLL